MVYWQWLSDWSNANTTGVPLSKLLFSKKLYSPFVQRHQCFAWLPPVPPSSCRSVHRTHAAGRSQTNPRASTVASNLPNASAFWCWRVDGVPTSPGLLPYSSGTHRKSTSLKRAKNSTVCTHKVSELGSKEVGADRGQRGHCYEQKTVDCWVTKTQRDHRFMALQYFVVLLCIIVAL